MTSDPFSYIINWVLVLICIIGTGYNCCILRWPEVIFYTIMGIALVITLIKQNKEQIS